MSSLARRIIAVALLSTSVLSFLSALTVNEEFTINTYKSETLVATDADFNVSITEYLQTNGLPDQNAVIPLDRSILDSGDIKNLRIFNVTASGDMANSAVRVEVFCKRMNDTSDSEKYIPVSISYSKTLQPTNPNYCYTKPVLYEPAGEEGMYYRYYYRYYNKSDTSRTWDINKDKQTKIPINWYIQKQYYRTASGETKETTFQPRNSDVSQGDRSDAYSVHKRPYVGCPKAYDGNDMFFSISVDFFLSITKANWDANMVAGHTYRMEVNINITPV